MARPTIKVEVAFGSTWQTASPTWTNITTYVLDDQGVRWSRGRGRDSDSIQAGTATLTVRNGDDRFTPGYTGGPYSTGVVPLVPIRITATWSSTTYDLWRGFVREWRPDWSNPGNPRVALDCVDGIRVLGQTNVRSLYFSKVLAQTPTYYWSLHDCLPFTGRVDDLAGNSHVGDSDVYGDTKPGGGAGIRWGAVASYNLADNPYTAGVVTTTSAARLSGTGDFTIGLWWHGDGQDMTGGLGNLRCFFMQMASANNYIYLDYNSSSSKVEFGLYNNPTSQTITSTSTVSTNEPHFIAVTRSGTTLTLYVDGVSAGSTTGTAQSITSAVSYWGRRGDGTGSQNMRGRISDCVAEVGSAWSSGVISQLWDAGRGYHGDLPGARVDRILDAIAWPSGLRDADPEELAISTVTNIEHVPNLTPVAENRTALALLEECADCMDGNVYIDAAGKLCWRDWYSSPVSLRSMLATLKPAGYWPLNETSGTTCTDRYAELLYGNSPPVMAAYFGWTAHNGTYQNTPTLNAGSLLEVPDATTTDTSVSFAAASSEYVSIADADQLEGGDAFFIGAWVRPNNFTTERPIIAKSDAAASDWWLVIGTDGKLRCGFVNGGGTTREATTSTAMTAGQTYYVRGWFSRYNQVCFAQWTAEDGTEGSGSASGVVNSDVVRDTTKAVWIGRRHGNYMDGRIAHVFWGNDLSRPAGTIGHPLKGMWRAANLDGELTPYADAEWAFEEQRIANKVRLEFGSSPAYPDGVLDYEEVSDTNSTSVYGERRLVKSGLPIEYPAICSGAYAYRLLQKQANPKLRALNVTMQGDLSPAALWPRLLALEIGDRPYVEHTTWAGQTVTSYGYVERVEHQMNRSGWDVHVQLSGY